MRKIKRMILSFALIIPFIAPIAVQAEETPKNVNIINVMNRVVHRGQFMAIAEGQTTVIHGRQYSDTAEEGDSATAVGQDENQHVATPTDIMNVGKDVIRNAEINNTKHGSNGYVGNYENHPGWGRDLSHIAGLTDDMMKKYQNEMHGFNFGESFNTNMINPNEMHNLFGMQIAMSQNQWNNFLDALDKEFAKYAKGIPIYGQDGKYDGGYVGGVDDTGINKNAGAKASGVGFSNVPQSDSTNNVTAPIIKVDWPTLVGESIKTWHAFTGIGSGAPGIGQQVLLSPKVTFKGTIYENTTQTAVVDYDRMIKNKMALYINKNDKYYRAGGRNNAEQAGGGATPDAIKIIRGEANKEVDNKDTKNNIPIKLINNADYGPIIEELEAQLAQDPDNQEIKDQIADYKNSTPNAEVGDTTNGLKAIANSNLPIGYAFNNLSDADMARIAADLFDKLGFTFDPNAAMAMMQNAMGGFNTPFNFKDFMSAVDNLKKNFSMLSNGLTPYSLNYLNSRDAISKYKQFMNDLYFNNRYGLMNDNMNWGNYFNNNQPYINVTAIKEVNLKQVTENVTYYGKFNQDYLWRIYDSSGKEVGVYETGTPELYIMAGKPDTYTYEQFQRADVYLATVKEYRIRYYIFSPVTNTLLAAWEDADNKVYPQDGKTSSQWVKVEDGIYQTFKGNQKIKKNSDLWDTQQIK